MVTAYDFPSAQVVEEAGADLVLVGDSGAMTVLGHDSTVPVGMDEMLMLAAAVRRGPEDAAAGRRHAVRLLRGLERAGRSPNAQRFIKEAGCDAVKLERGGASVDRARAIIRAGIPVMGHVGLTPQTATALGGYKAQGRTGERAVADRRGRLRAAGGRLLRDRLRGGPRRGDRGDHAEHGGARDRHRRRRGDRRAGARLPRPARHQHRAHARGSSSATRRSTTRWSPGSPTTWPTSASAASPTSRHTYSIDPDELLAFADYLDQDTLAGKSKWDW